MSRQKKALLSDHVLDTVPSFSTACKICGKPIKGGECLKKIVPMLCHNECLDKREATIKAREIQANEQRRTKDWEAMCPKEFAKPLNWNKCSREFHRQVMSWTFGERGLYVEGPTSQCKTRFMYQLLKREFSNGRTVAIYTHAEFRKKVALLAKSDMDSAARFMAHLNRVDIVCIDDLGGGVVNPMSEEAFETLVDARFKNNKPMMFTTAMDSARISVMFSSDRVESILRRIHECCDVISRFKHKPQTN